jgi:hypothetical protein
MDLFAILVRARNGDGAAEILTTWMNKRRQRWDKNEEKAVRLVDFFMIDQ